MTAWRAAAHCAPDVSPLEPQAFDADRLPDESNEDRQFRHTLARIVCGQCPVAEQCLDEALADPDREGVYAGYLLQNERTTT